MMSRRLQWEGCLNVRDAGGLPTRDGRTIRRGALVRSDHLSNLTEAGRRALEEHGIRTVLDLRAPGEVRNDGHHYSRIEYGGQILYRNLPIAMDADLLPDGIFQGTKHNGEGYLRMVDRRPGNIAAALTAFAEAPEGGVLVHCYAGKDRTGLIVALLLSLAGVDEETIAADYAQSQDNLRERYLTLMAAQPEGSDEWLRLRGDAMTPAEWMLDLLAYLNARYGGVEAYVRTAGVTPEAVSMIRARLLPE